MSPSKPPARTTGASNGIADVISELESLRTTVETLERKLFATEQSQAQKVRKIAELEQTIRTLTEKNDYLEKDLKNLQELIT
jgi:chromosome segregation ATPase